MSYLKDYFNEVTEITSQLNNQETHDAITTIVEYLSYTRKYFGRVFVLGIGGSAGNASHMVNDLRKLCALDAIAPTDNVSEFTARTNDNGFESAFTGFLEVSRIKYNDTLFVLSVGGGDRERNISTGLINAIDLAKSKGAAIISITGKPDGYAAKNSHVNITVPQVNPDRITPHSEAFQAILWHCIVSHPNLQTTKTTW